MQHCLERGKRPVVHVGRRQLDVAERRRAEGKLVELLVEELAAPQVQGRTASHPGPKLRDRKSTRLNSSHGYISYAVFCLKKKKKTTIHLKHRTALHRL